MTADELSAECSRVRGGIPASKFEEWRQGAEEFGKTAKLHIPQEVWDAGSWLKEQLLERGAGDDLATEIVQGVGQRQAMIEQDADPWGPAVAALANYAKGEWELSGPELADKLIVERFGNPPDKARMLSWLLSSRTGRHAMDVALGIEFVDVVHHSKEKE